MGGINIPSFEERFRRLVRDVELLQTAVRRAGLPRQITSDTRPDPLRLQPGTPLFETDTNRTIFVNATQDAFVLGDGTVV